MDTDKQEDVNVADVLMEFLEVLINTVLYVRNIYPDGIFKKYQKYNMAVMMNCHPELANYVKDVLGSIQSFLVKGEVEKLVLQIISKDDVPLERFCFEMKFMSDERNCCFFDLEQHLRGMLLKLNACEAMLSPLPDGSSFQLLAHTKNSSLKEMERKSNFQEFPWAVVDSQSKESDNSMSIIPVRSCSNEAFVMQCYIEENLDSKAAGKLFD